MSAVLASYVSYRGMVDGTLRVTLDIEPKDVAAAHQLFNKPGAPVAIARLTDAAAQKASQTPAVVAGQEGDASLSGRSEGSRPAASPSERKPLTLPQQVALTCQQKSFHRYIQNVYGVSWKNFVTELSGDASDAELVACIVRRLCNVTSRAQIKEGTAAASYWERIEADYLDYQRRAS